LGKGILGIISAFTIWQRRKQAAQMFPDGL